MEVISIVFATHNFFAALFFISPYGWNISISKWAMKKNLGWLGYMGDDILSSCIGITIN